MHRCFCSMIWEETDLKLRTVCVAPALPFTYCRLLQTFLSIHLDRNNESDIRRMDSSQMGR